MITVTIGLIIWSIIVLGIIGMGFWGIYSSINNSLKNDYKYCINLHKVGFEKTNYPIIKMKIRNKYKYFLLDSGANINALSQEVLSSIMKKEDSLKIVGNGQILGIGATDNVAIPIIEENISVGRDKFIEEFRVVDNWETTRKAMSQAAGVEIVGLLGAEFFKRAKWVLDFESLVVWVKK